MSCTSDFDESDNFTDHWTSSDSECSFREKSNGDSLNEISDKVDSSSDSELNDCDGKKLLVSESDSESNFTRTNSRSSAINHSRKVDEFELNSKLDSASEGIPDLVDDECMVDVEIPDDTKLSQMLPDESDDEFVMEQLKKLIVRRNKKDHEAHLRWLTFLREQKEAEEEEKQFKAYWQRRQQEDKDLWRDKDFANAIYKMCRAGYKGKYGHFDVTEQILQQLNALYMQITVGDYDGNKRLKCAKEWEKLRGETKIDCQKKFIKITNQTITMYGWNPPDGWL